MDSKFEYGEGSNVGLVRSNNEDSALSAPDIGLFLIADGMGGHDAGEVASQIVKESVLESIQSNKSLKEAIHKSHKDVKDAAANNIGSPNMGTTIVALLSKGNNYQVAWVGDSRAYQWNSSSNQLNQISKDHSYVQALFDAGSISKADMDTHPQKNIITQSLGVSDIDSVIVDSIEREWQPGDKILLCSDGLTDLVSDQEIGHTFRKLRGKSNQELVNTLIQAALDKGGVDNVSIQVISAPELKQVSFIQTLSESKHLLALIAVCFALTATLLWLLFK
jgi:protein phosphatase